MFERDRGFESYIGIPIFDGERNVIGHLACMDAVPLAEEFPIQPIFTLFAVRAGLELERRSLRLRLRAAA